MKKTILLLAAVFSSLTVIHATNTVVVSGATIPQGGTGTISVGLNNDKSYTAFTMKLTLPEGITFNSVTPGSRMKESHSLSGNTSTGMITCLSTSNQLFGGTSGELFTITVSASEATTVGTTLQATLTEVNFSTTSAEEQLDNVTFDITIGEPADTRTVLDENSTTIPTSATNVDVRVRRTIKANEWSTICLPFAMTEGQVKECFGDDVQLADFTGYDTEEDDEDNIVGLTINFNDVSAIEENHPYIIKVSSAITEFTVDGVEINPVSEPMINKGTKKIYKKFIGTYVANTTLEANTLFLNSNNFYYSTGLTKMKAFRAYFDFFDILTEVEEASSVKLWVNDDDDATGIESIDHSSLNIDHRYNLAGQRVGKNYKGIVIENGKKIKK